MNLRELFSTIGGIRMKKSGLLMLVFSLLLVIGVLQACGNSKASGNDVLKTVRLDYAYYSPTSLVLKKFGWLEEEFKKDNVKVEWTLSQGSNKALEFLTSNSIDFGSAAGAASLITKTKEVPIQNIYVLSQPEWTALVSLDDSIKSINDLKGKKVAATYGTDPYIFLLRALDEQGLSEKDIKFVNLQHNDGYQALVKGDVAAWAGLDPIMATAEQEAKAKLFYRNTEFNTYNFLNVREEFKKAHPEAVEKVIKSYEKARKWIQDNPDEAAEIISKEAKIDLNTAKIQLERTNFDQPIPGKQQVEALNAAGEVLQKAKVIKSNVDIEKTTNNLVEPSIAKKVIK